MTASPRKQSFASEASSTEEPPLPRRLSRQLSRAKSGLQSNTRRFVRKPRNLVAVVLFLAFPSHIALHRLQQWRLVRELGLAHDYNKDQVLSQDEIGRLLRDNNVDLSQEQVRKIFGKIDDEDNGYDRDELVQILKVVAFLPGVPDTIQQMASNRSIFLDLVFIIVAGVSLVYLVSQSEMMEKKWAQRSFRDAVHFGKMKVKCDQLDEDLKKLSQERECLERGIQEMEKDNAGDLVEREEELNGLRKRLKEVCTEQDEANEKLERAAANWQREAEKSMHEVSRYAIKMERMMKCVRGLGACVKGLEAFSGLGRGEFNSMGATNGFCSNGRSFGFAMDNITFGTLDTDPEGNDQLRLYQTGRSRKLGEGRDCAYHCTDLTTGKELALKMYKINSKVQRQAIQNDLCAHMSQVGKHPRIVSYERVIETEQTIFVLMELIAGKDLYEVVAERWLSEEDVRPLFAELVDSLKHLHSKGIIHCDVKPENAMVVGNIDLHTAHIKLIDFGCSCFKVYEESLEGSVVWDMYIPPEHSLNPATKPQVSTDMWRLGCTLYVMLVRRPPFHDNAHTPEGREQRKAGAFCRRAPYDQLSREAQDLISSLIVGDPSKRLTTAQVLEHPWIRGEPLQ